MPNLLKTAFIAFWRSGRSKFRTGRPVKSQNPLPNYQWDQSALMLKGINGVDDDKLYDLNADLLRSIQPWGVGVGLHWVDQWTIAIEGYMINGATLRFYINPVITHREMGYFKIRFAHMCLEAAEL